MKSVLQISDLTVRRGDNVLLADLSWEVFRGQHWAMVGPNGCGKSTLLRTLTGYLSATAGKIKVLDQTYGESDWRDLRLKVGIVTSALQASIPPAETVLETVVSGRYAQLDLWVEPTREDQTHALAALKQVRLAHLAQRPWLYLSQGERQRTLIARALMLRPALLILDEPCAGLDPIAREEFLALIDGLAKSRNALTLVLVTHHVEEILPCFSHTLLLKAGRVLAAGLTAETLTSAKLSHLFDRRVRLRRQNQRFGLSVALTSRYEST